MSQKRVSKLEKGKENHRFFFLSHSRLYVRFQISICKVNFQRIGLNRRVSLSRLLRTEKPFKNIFFYAVARHEMMVSGYEKNVAEFLDISFFYGPWTLRTKSFLIDGGWWCCWVIQKLWRESKAKLCHQKIQYLHSWSWLERKENLEKVKFQESFHRSKKESQSGKDAHTLRSKEGFKADHFFKDSNWEKNLFTA